MTTGTKRRNLSKRLLAYSTAAAMVATVAGEVLADTILTNPEPDTLVGGGIFDLSFDNPAAVPLPPGADMVAEFRLDAGLGGYGSFLLLEPFFAGSDVGLSVLGSMGGLGYIYPFRLATGASVSAGAAGWQNITGTAGFLSYSSGGNGNWPLGSTGYLGVRFTLNGGATPFYGWIKLTNPPGLGYVIEGYAYNDIPGGSIIAGGTPTAVTTRTVETVDEGQPAGFIASIMALFGGLTGWAFWRRKRS